MDIHELVFELLQARQDSAYLWATMIFFVIAFYLWTYASAHMKVPQTKHVRDFFISDRFVPADVLVWHPQNESYFELHRARQSVSQSPEIQVFQKASLPEALVAYFLRRKSDWTTVLVIRADIFLADDDREALVLESMQRQAVIVSGDLSLPFAMPHRYAHRLVLDTMLDNSKMSKNADGIEDVSQAFTNLGVPIQRANHKIAWQSLE